jgi:hypothetical protein
MECDAAESIKPLLTFRRNTLSPSVESNRKPSKQSALFLLASFCLFRLFSDTEDTESMFFY